jgi:hypothetical protein
MHIAAPPQVTTNPKIIINIAPPLIICSFIEVPEFYVLSAQLRPLCMIKLKTTIPTTMAQPKISRALPG